MFLRHEPPVRGRTQDPEAAHEVIADGHHGTRVVELPTVVRRGEKGHQLTVRLKFVTVFHNLYGRAYVRVDSILKQAHEP